jgi:hypothetical protein
LDPLDFYLWGHLETLVYEAPVDSEEALYRRFVDVCQIIRNYPGIYERIRQSMMRRVEACIKSRGHYFDILFCMFCFSYNSQIVSPAHTSVDISLVLVCETRDQISSQHLTLYI